MKREELKNRLDMETACVRVPEALAQRTLSAAQGKERPCMKKKISLAAAFALLAVTLCAAAIAAANRWGMLDFVDRYSAEHYIPEDAQDYVKTDVAALENDWVKVGVRELYYDGRVSRITVDVTPKAERTLIVGEDVCMEDSFINLTHEYVMDGENDMRSVYQVVQDEGYAQVYCANVGFTEQDVIMGTMDYILGADGTLTIYSQEEYMTDMPTRETNLRVIVTPFDQPLAPDSYADYEERDVLQTPVTLTACASPAAQTGEGELPNVYVSEAGADYPGAGVRVDRVVLEVKPHEIAAAIEYSVTDRAVFDGTQGGLWFEFIDPQKEGEPWEQRLAAGLTGSSSAGAVDPQEEEPVQFCQRETLGRNELHEVYTLRAFDAWEKGRYETREIRMRPATAEDMEE